jgi:apolipoprotein N-acyltransferase
MARVFYQRQVSYSAAGSAGGGARPDLVVWPETAVPVLLENAGGLLAEIGAAAQTPVLLGIQRFQGWQIYNSAVLIGPDGAQRAVYDKHHLVPFGEYVPLREEFPLLAAIVGDLVPDDFDAGTQFEILEMASRPVKLAPLVCFEDTLGDLARRFAQRGAQAFVVVTNDGWFLKSAGSMQHLHNAVFRCVETKLPMIRAANTGVTCAIDRLGTVREVLCDDSGSTFTQGVLFSRIDAPSHPEHTFDTRHGEVFSISCLAATALAIATCLARRKLQNSSCPNPPDTKPSAA